MIKNQRIVSKASYAITLCLLVVSALAFFFAAYQNLFSLRDVTLPEGAIIYSIKQLLADGSIYNDYTKIPYSITPYTPLFYLVSAAFTLISSKTAADIYSCCRLLSVASTVLAAFFVQRIMLRIKPENSLLQSIALLLPFTILILIAWGYAARPDMMALMLSLAGIYLYLRDQKQSINIYGAAILLALSWWCKQSFIAAPIAIFLALLYSKEWKQNILFTLSYIAALFLLVGVTEYFSQGWFYKNIITANVTTLKPAQVYWLTLYGYFGIAPFITGAALFAVCIFRNEIMTHTKLRLVVIYLLVSAGFNMAACMKEGAYFNYMIEPLFIASVLAALAVEWVLKQPRIAIAVPLLLFLSLIFSYNSYLHYEDDTTKVLWADKTQANAEIQSVIDKMDSLPGDQVLASSSYLAARSQKTPLITDLFNTRYLEEKGKLSTDALAEKIRHKELAAIVAYDFCQPDNLKCDRWPIHLRQAIIDQYTPSETLFGQVFWYPKIQ